MFDENADQETMFSAVMAPVVDNFLNNRSGLIFAYGQSNSGKTHTIQVRALLAVV